MDVEHSLTVFTPILCFFPTVEKMWLLTGSCLVGGLTKAVEPKAKQF